MAKAPTDLRSLARSHTETAINTLAGIMKEPRAPHSARVAAASYLLDRGWGRPKQDVDMTHRTRPAREMTDNELADIALGSGEGADTAPLNPSQLN